MVNLSPSKVQKINYAKREFESTFRQFKGNLSNPSALPNAPVGNDFSPSSNPIKSARVEMAREDPANAVHTGTLTSQNPQP